jgi:aspartyl-tRNA synthetase
MSQQLAFIGPFFFPLAQFDDFLRCSRTYRTLVLRDGYGSTQVKFELPQDSTQNLSELLKSTPLESILAVRGKVSARPDNMRNTGMPTGEIEIEAVEIEILNRAVNVPLPFQRDVPDTTTEESRLRYRYLELRQPYLQRNIRLRSKILQIIRHSLVSNNFNEIETPTLFRKTSEGAKEFLVPTRSPGKVYVLTQSPQQYKQMLMASGFDRCVRGGPPLLIIVLFMCWQGCLPKGYGF